MTGKTDSPFTFLGIKGVSMQVLIGVLSQSVFNIILHLLKHAIGHLICQRNCSPLTIFYVCIVKLDKPLQAIKCKWGLWLKRFIRIFESETQSGMNRMLFGDFGLDLWSRTICDVIEQNELELTNAVFKIQLNKADSFSCFLLFVQSFNCCILGANCPISVGFSPN